MSVDDKRLLHNHRRPIKVPLVKNIFLNYCKVNALLEQTIIELMLVLTSLGLNLTNFAPVTPVNTNII